MAEHASIYPESAPTYRLALSLTIEADYRNRGVFPGLRIEAATKRAGTWLYFDVPVDFARSVLEDAQERYKERADMPRGRPAAYTALIRNLGVALDAAEGVTCDPGFDKWLTEQRDASVLLAVGQRVLTVDGDPVVILGEYRLRKVNDPDGPYRDNDGSSRFRYQYGYTAKGEDGKVFFWTAGDLYAANGEQAHLRLVRSEGKAVHHG